MVILSIEVQPLNAELPISVTLSGRVMLVIRSQPLNAPAGMVDTLSGITISPESSTSFMYNVLSEFSR